MKLPIEMLDWTGRQILKQEVAKVQSKLAEAEKKLFAERAARAEDQAIIEQLKLTITKMQRDQYGAKSEHSVRLQDPVELTADKEDAAALLSTPVQTATIINFERRKPAKKPFPAHLPRERIVVPAPTFCTCCGGARLAKLGEDITETLEVIPRRWKVVQTVREKFTCRDCEKVSQAPAPYHVIPRGFAGPSFLAMVLFEKYGQHQPLHRQSERYVREGIELGVSTLVGLVGAGAEALRPLYDRLWEHVLESRYIHGDDTVVPVLAKGKTITGRVWTYVRDERPFGSQAPPAVVFAYSRDRRAVHVQKHLASWSGILLSDAYAGYRKLSQSERPAGVIRHAYCWAHARRQFFKLADIERAARNRRQNSVCQPASPVAREAVRRIDELFTIERRINGLPTAERLAVRKEHSAPRAVAFESWMRQHRADMSKHGDSAKAIDYLLTRWAGFTAFLDDGRIGLDNNAAERALRSIAVGRKNWTFCGSDRGGEYAAVLYSLIGTCKLSGVDPQAWLADVLSRIAAHPAKRLDELLPWNWKTSHAPVKQAA